MNNNEKLSISVIIPCYNSSSTILRAINSVLEQSLLPDEIILVDDASKDDTLKKLNDIYNTNKFLFKIVSLQTNNGAGCARNSGWNIATCDYVTFLDSDDTWHKDKLLLQFNYMKNNRKILISGHLISQATHEVMSRELFFDFQRVKIINKTSLLFTNQIFTPSVVMIRGEVQFRFPEKQRYSEDYCLWLKLAYNDHSIVRIEQTLAFAHKPAWGHSGLSSHLYEMEKGELGNFFSLYKEGKILFPLFIISSAWSILKFFRRIIYVSIIKLF